MGITVYAVSGAPRAWRVLLGLTFKGIDYDIHYLEASKREHKSEAYLKINPRGNIPALVRDGQTIRDSVAILAWLDRAYLDSPLFRATADEAAVIWQVTMESCDYLRDAADALLRPLFFGGATEKTPELIQAAGTMQKELGHLETQLGTHDFLAGGKPTAADAVSYPEVRFIQRAAETQTGLMANLGFEASFASYPHIVAWKQRVEAVEGFEKTLPPHWNA